MFLLVYDFMWLCCNVVENTGVKNHQCYSSFLAIDENKAS